MVLYLRQIDFYRTDENKCPVEEFFDSLDSKAMQKVVWTLQLIKEIDLVPKQYFKKLDDLGGTAPEDVERSLHEVPQQGLLDQLVDALAPAP